MSREDRRAFWSIIVGLSWGGLTMAGPRAFPDMPPLVWQVSACLAGIVVIAGLSVLAYDFFIRPRFKGRGLDPFLATAMIASLVAFVSLGIYAIKGAVVATGSSSNSPAIASQPEITLQVPKNRYEFRWDPSQTMQIVTRLGRVLIDPARWELLRRMTLRSDSE
jgi:hypothetical protein